MKAIYQHVSGDFFEHVSDFGSWIIIRPLGKAGPELYISPDFMQYYTLVKYQ